MADLYNYISKLKELNGNRKQMSRMLENLSYQSRQSQGLASFVRLIGSGSGVYGGLLALAALSGGGLPLAAAALGFSSFSGVTLCGTSFYEWLTSSGYVREWEQLLDRDQKFERELCRLLQMSINNGSDSIAKVQLVFSAAGYGAAKINMGQQGVRQSVKLGVQSVEGAACLMNVLFLPVNVFTLCQSVKDLGVKNRTGLAKYIEESAASLKQKVDVIDNHIRWLEMQLYGRFG